MTLNRSLTMLTLSVLCIPGQIQAETAVSLTVSERERLVNNPVITAGIDTDWPLLGSTTREKLPAGLTKGQLDLARHGEVDTTQILTFALITGTLLLTLAWAYSIRRQRERLRISDERFQMAMDAASVGLWDWNAKTGDVYYSPLWMSMLGYDTDELPHTFDTFCELLHPDDRERTLRDNQQMLDDPTARYEQEFRLRAKDGSYRWILSRGHVFSRDEMGRALRALGTHTDITRRKQAEIDVQRLNLGLTAANERFALAAKAISLGVWERTTDGSNMLRFDDRLFEIYGLEKTDLLPVRTWLERVHPDDRRRVTDSLRTVLREGGEAHADFRAYRTDGQLRYIYAAVTAIKGGECDQLFGVNWDITERKLAEHQFERVVNALPIAIAIADAKGRILLANPQATQEFGEGQSLVGRRTTELYDDNDQRQEILADVARDGQIIAKEIHYKTPSGRRIDGLFSAIPITFDGQPALLGVVANITERRKMEQALARAKEQAEEANRFKGRFLANMSHEIRTPMNAIVGLGHLLNRTTLTLQQQDYLGKMQISARSLLTLIDDILDLSKIEAGELRIEEIDFDLGKVLDTIATLASTRLAEKDVEFVYDIETAVPARLRGDPHRLTQILTNLISNAIKFTEGGSIILRIRIIEDRQPLRLLFSVEDTGVGIPADKIESLFLPFTQADGSTTREYGGTGLGLSICQQLVGLMGGSTSAESTVGKGSCFEFQLPFDMARPEDHPRSKLDTANLRVLLVDDNPIARQVLGDLLQSLAFRVEVAPSGQAALKKITDDSKPYDLVLIDWQMPDTDGLETAQLIRSAELTRTPRIVLMTAYGREVSKQSIDLSSVDGFLVKPITPSQLLDTVAQAMGTGKNADTSTAEAKPVQRQLHGTVLLVEDNPINQQVARELLEQMGLAVTVARSGRESIEQVAESRPDLVLMDIQMPDIDGYQATARIRELPGTAALPIIAMTANAMIGDAERSIEFGLNGHIAKPIDPILLYDTLHAWLRGGDNLTRRNSPATRKDDVGSHDRSSDQTSIEHSRDLTIDFVTGERRVGGNRALYARLLSDFASTYRDTASLIEAQCRAHQARQLEMSLHTLRGVAGNVGAQALAGIAAKFEQCARSDDIEQIRNGLPEFKLALDQAVEAADAFASGLPNLNTGVAIEPDDRAPLEQLSDLAQLLQAGDAESVERVAKLPDAMFASTATPLLARLREQVGEYDFTAAADSVAELIEQIRRDEDTGRHVD